MCELVCVYAVFLLRVIAHVESSHSGRPRKARQNNIESNGFTKAQLNSPSPGSVPCPPPSF